MTKVTQVAIRPTPQSEARGRPSLTPELLAASGARYSRNNEGLDQILSRIDWNDLDKSVDSIFVMLDYGHRSIADMVPVALFIDSLSIYAAYILWWFSAQASGQESSTRYIRLSADGLPEAVTLGLTPGQAHGWQDRMHRLFEAYERAANVWTKLSESDPSLMRIPQSLLQSEKPKDRRTVERMRRNYAFDRARYLLPAAALTNMMMVMSARAWSDLCQFLLSHPLPELQQIGIMIRDEMAIASPRLIRHAMATESHRRTLQRAHDQLVCRAKGSYSKHLEAGNPDTAAPATPFLRIHWPEGPYAVSRDDFTEALTGHNNRYDYAADVLRRTGVVYGWNAVAFGDIRDLNRHRTGSRYCPPIPLGFYGAMDQFPDGGDPQLREELKTCVSIGQQAAAEMARQLVDGNPANVYEMPLGAQFYFEHSTHADKYIYTAELRTGTGAHYRYAQHMRESLGLWYEVFPGTRGLILEGSAEPE